MSDTSLDDSRQYSFGHGLRLNLDLPYVTRPASEQSLVSPLTSSPGLDVPLCVDFCVGAGEQNSGPYVLLQQASHPLSHPFTLYFVFLVWRIHHL